MIVARFVWIFATDAVVGALRRIGLASVRPLGGRAALVISWAGMRGVVTLAVALSLPAAMPERDLMLVAAFAVILVTVLVQGTSLGWMIKHARPAEDPAALPPLDLHAAEHAMFRGNSRRSSAKPMTPTERSSIPQLLRRYRTRAAAGEAFDGTPEERNQAIARHFDVIIAAVEAGRAELVRLHRGRPDRRRDAHDLEHDLDLEELGAVAAKG